VPADRTGGQCRIYPGVPANSHAGHAGKVAASHGCGPARPRRAAPCLPGPVAGDRNAELSNANKSCADRRVTGDPPCSSPACPVPSPLSHIAAGAQPQVSAAVDQHFPKPPGVRNYFPFTAGASAASRPLRSTGRHTDPQHTGPCRQLRTEPAAPGAMQAAILATAPGAILARAGLSGVTSGRWCARSGRPGPALPGVRRPLVAVEAE
jgi:hypothetical protein